MCAKIRRSINALAPSYSSKIKHTYTHFHPDLVKHSFFYALQLAGKSFVKVKVIINSIPLMLFHYEIFNHFNLHSINSWLRKPLNQVSLEYGLLLCIYCWCRYIIQFNSIFDFAFLMTFDQITYAMLLANEIISGDKKQVIINGN